MFFFLNNPFSVSFRELLQVSSASAYIGYTCISTRTCMLFEMVYQFVFFKSK